MQLSNIRRKINTYVKELTIQIKPFVWNVQKRAFRSSHNKTKKNENIQYQEPIQRKNRKCNIVLKQKVSAEMKKKNCKDYKTKLSTDISDKQQKVSKHNGKINNICEKRFKKDQLASDEQYYLKKLIIPLTPLSLQNNKAESTKISSLCLKESKPKLVERDLKVLISPFSTVNKKVINSTKIRDNQRNLKTGTSLSLYEIKPEQVKRDLKVLISPFSTVKKKVINSTKIGDNQRNLKTGTSLSLNEIKPKEVANQKIQEKNINNAAVHLQTTKENDREHCINRISTPLVSRLRHKERKNYLEMSEGRTLVEKSYVKPVDNVLPNHKVPIYKQIMIERKINEKEDPYELDVSDADKPQKSSKHKKYTKPKKEPKLNIWKKIKLKPSKKRINSGKRYEANIQQVLNRIISKNNIATKDTSPTKAIITNNTNTKTYPLDRKTSSIQKTNQNNVQSNKTNQGKILLPIIQSENNIISNALRNNDCPSPDIFHDDLDIVYNGPASPDIFQNDDSNGPLQTIDEYFGFNEEDEPPRVQIISNVLLNKSVSIPSQSKFTDTAITEKSRKLPWRSPALNSVNYLLHYHKNSMPCLQQDSILDSKLVDKIEEQCSKNKSVYSSKPENSKATVQTSLLDFIETSRQIDDHENNQENRLSLFDYEEFVTRHPRQTLASRKILGVLDQNQIESTPIKNKKMDNISPDISMIPNDLLGCSPEPDATQSPLKNFTVVDETQTYFGFESRDEDISPVLTRRPSDAKPFRVKEGIIRRLQKEKRKAEDEVEVWNDELPSVLQSSAERGMTDKVGQLFDDVEPELLLTINEPITYGKKRRHRKRLYSYSEDPEEMPKKKKKDLMTPAEKIQFDQWASEFNAMCDEIDKHELEID